MLFKKWVLHHFGTLPPQISSVIIFRQSFVKVFSVVWSSEEFNKNTGLFFRGCVYWEFSNQYEEKPHKHEFLCEWSTKVFAFFPLFLTVYSFKHDKVHLVYGCHFLCVVEQAVWKPNRVPFGCSNGWPAFPHENWYVQMGKTQVLDIIPKKIYSRSEAFVISRQKEGHSYTHLARY